MAYRIYHENDILRIDFRETVTSEEIADFAKSLRQVEGTFPMTPDHITDFSKTTNLNVSFADALEFAERRKNVRFPNDFKSAIVASTPLHLGMARMFAALNDNAQITIRIFPDIAAALEWIGPVRPAVPADEDPTP